MKTVLVVDDVKTDRALTARVVADSGHQSVFAADGIEAIEKAKELLPALILMDIVMPKKDGFAACRALKKDPATADIPLILVSSKNTDTDKAWATRQGANGYICKPFDPNELLQTIRQYL